MEVEDLLIEVPTEEVRDPVSLDRLRRDRESPLDFLLQQCRTDR